MRRRWRAKWPSVMKSERTAWSRTGACRRVTAIAAVKCGTRSGGEHQVGETKGWEEDFAEGAEENHLAARIEALQRRHRTSGVAVLAVVVVFEDQRAGGAGPLQQFQPPRQRHGHSQRKLVRRSDVDQARTAQPPVRDFHPLVVERDGADFRSDALEHLGRSLIPRLLHADAVSGIEDQ